MLARLPKVAEDVGIAAARFFQGVRQAGMSAKDFAA